MSPLQHAAAYHSPLPVLAKLPILEIIPLSLIFQYNLWFAFSCQKLGRFSVAFLPFLSYGNTLGVLPSLINLNTSKNPPLLPFLSLLILIFSQKYEIKVTLLRMLVLRFIAFFMQFCGL